MPRGRGAGRGWRQQSGKGVLMPALLLLLTREESHGYLLLSGLDEFGFNSEEVDPSLVYRILREMEELGWVESYFSEESLGPKRRVYRLLPKGKEHLSKFISGLHHRRDQIESLITAYDTAMKNE